MPEAPEKQISPEIVRTILQKGVDFEITVKHRSLLHRIKLLPSSRKYIVYPINLGTLLSISQIIATMEETKLTGNEDLFATGIKSIVDNQDKIVEVIALGILNRKLSSPFDRFRKWYLMRDLNNNLNASELLQLVQLITAQMDVADFLASFVSIKKLNLVEAKKPEIIQTSGESSAG